MIKNISAVILAAGLLLGMCGCIQDPAVGEIKETPSAASDAESKASEPKHDTPEVQDETESALNEPGAQLTYADVLSGAFDGVGGKVSYAFHSYSDGVRVSSGEGRFKSASVIKLFIMDYAYALSQRGDISMDTTVSGRRLSDIIESMITVSDNNATNTLIEYFGMDKINEYIRSEGYADTVLARKMLDTAAAAQGRENYTSASDVMKLLDTFYANQDVMPYKAMLDTMKRQRVSTKIRRNFPADVVIANKTGELSDTENDVGIVFSDGGDFALVCLTNNSDSASAQNAIANAAYDLYRLINKK